MDDENYMFTFIWKVENGRMILKEKRGKIDSPLFKCENYWNTTWYLTLHPFGDNENDEVSCYLNYNKNSDGPYTMNLYFNIICTDVFKKSEIEHGVNKTVIKKGEKTRYENFKFLYPSSHRINNYVIFIVCHIWNVEMLIFYKPLPRFTNLKKSSEPVKAVCLNKKEPFFKVRFARTIISIEKKTFTWSTEDILKTKNIKHVTVKFNNVNIPGLFICLSQINKNSLLVEIQTTHATVTPFKALCHMWISDFEGNIGCFDSNEREFNLSETEMWYFMYKSVSKINNFLHFEILISTGYIFNWSGDTPDFDVPIQDLTKDFHYVNKLEETMRNIYTNKLFCDATLCLQDKSFPIHKAVLCEVSPVFKTMFESTMLEIETNIVRIEDMDERTLNRMLRFMYCDSIEELEFESIMKLYEAADRFKISALQDKCVIIILSNISVQNVLHVINTANVHSDKKLFSLALQYLFLHLNDILFTEKWKNFATSHLHLANEILHEMCAKFLT